MHPDYKVMGPTLNTGKNKIANPNEKGYYDPSNPG